MEKYFLILKTVNLGHYFSRGLITPSNYINSWIDDFQCKIDNTILLTHNLVLDESTCGIELEIVEDEKQYIKEISNGFSILNRPLPISRIKNIYFENEKQSETTILNIESADAFVPKEIIKIHEEESDSNLEVFDFSYQTPLDEELIIKQKLFDKLLGGFALMRIAKEDDFKEYSENYFNYLAFINYEVRNKIKDLNIDFNTDLIKAIEIGDYEKLPYIYKEMNVAIANKLLNKNLPISKFGVIQVDKIAKIKEFILAILSTYGNDYGKIKKIDDFISSLTSGRFNKKWEEQICLYFGINQGYNAFENTYRFDNKEIVVKFKLNSELDYSIIESIYQYVFNNKKENYQFDYLSWCPKFINNTNIQKYEVIKFFDKQVIIKKKIIPGSTEYLQKLLEQFSKINVFEIKTKISEFFQIIIDDMKKLNFDNNEEIKSLKLKLKEVENKKTIESELTLKSNNKLDLDQTAIELENDILAARLIALNKITQIGELKGIAKFVGIKNKGPFVKKDCEKLKNLIIEKLKEQ
ncbi:hypothetical protein SAMN04489722_10671 [Algibacter lectus]|uniref:hypothetical protein n=1 Tax=Algibacter lectus TaxID=221126 RepID=UPI0008E46530|nr:hypothetical protein [Algibacter lectus]SFD20918.1 hypothetical protein SAMN04489722_10671 [Algibacter lectus]